MQKVILDTNVIVSALISRSAPADILFHLVLTRAVMLCLSDAVYEEYVTVLNRKKFAVFPDFRINSEIVLSKLKSWQPSLLLTKK